MQTRKILHILKTPSLNNDSRVLKWIHSLNENNIKSSVLVLEDSNLNVIQNTKDYEFISYSLKSRNFFKKGFGTFFKVLENFFKVQGYLKCHREKYDLIIFHDNQNYLSLIYESLIVSKNKIIWDQHELIHSVLLNNFLSKLILRKVIKNIHLLIYANNARREYTNIKLKLPNINTFVLNNAVSKDYIMARKSELPIVLKNWIKETRYIIWLGEGSSRRNFDKFLKGFKISGLDYKIVILGKIESKLNKLIDNLQLRNLIFQTFVKPSEMASYIDSAWFSCVFYKNVSMNNFYCEPNRLYQLTTRNIPVIVGNNPSLKEYIERYGHGIVLEDDGSNEVKLAAAMNELNIKLLTLSKNAPNQDFPSWEDQFKHLLNNLK